MNKISKYYFYLQYKNQQFWFSVFLLVFVVVGSGLLDYWMVTNFYIGLNEYALNVFSFPNVLFTKLIRIILTTTPFISIFLASLIFGNDYLTGAIRTPLQRGLSRIKVYLSKWGTLSINITLGCVISGVIGVISSYIFSSRLGVPVSWVSGELSWAIVRAFLILAVMISAYVAFTGFIVTVTRSPMIGLTAGTMFYLFDLVVSDALLFPWAMQIKPYLLYNHAMTLLAISDDADLLLMISDDLVIPEFSWISFAVIILYCLILIGAGVLVFSKQNIKE